MEIKLGVKVKDKITGFEGIAVGKSTFLTGCDQYCISPKVGTDGAFKDSHWFDEGRLEFIDFGIESKEVMSNKNGGPECNAPKK